MYSLRLGRQRAIPLRERHVVDGCVGGDVGDVGGMGDACMDQKLTKHIGVNDGVLSGYIWRVKKGVIRSNTAYI